MLKKYEYKRYEGAIRRARSDRATSLNCYSITVVRCVGGMPDPNEEYDHNKKYTWRIEKIKRGIPNMNCKDCESWTAKKSHPHIGTCNNKKLIGADGKDGYSTELEKVPSDGIIVETDEGWGMFTGEYFGCVHFFPKRS